MSQMAECQLLNSEIVSSNPGQSKNVYGLTQINIHCRYHYKLRSTELDIRKAMGHPFVTIKNIFICLTIHWKKMYA